MKKIDPVKIYWEDFPENSDQFRNVLDPIKFQEPSKILNSTEVTAQPKPWLVKNVKPAVKPKNIPHVNIMANESKAKSFSKNESVAIVSAQKIPKSVGIKDLNPEDKQKIAKLIQELVKFGNEKQIAVKELNDVKENYSYLQKQLQYEKAQAIQEHELMKDKLMQYEILVEEIKSYQQKPQESIIDLDAKSESSLIDNFSDLFLEQEKKFQHQQNILQEQIEQLQQLQESVIKQQIENIGNKSNNTASPTVGLNSKKLESYLQQSASKRTNSTLTDISMQTETYDSKQNKVQSVKKSPVLTQVETYNEQLSEPMNRPVKHTVDMEVQTDCPQVPTLKNSPLVIKSSYKNQNRVLSSRMKCSSSRAPTISAEQRISPEPKTPSTKITKKQVHREFKKTIRHCSIPSQKSVCFSKATTSDEGDECVQEEEMVLVSPLQRKHFKPASMMELVEGLQPQSTSTSVDQYSMKQSSSLKSKSSTSSNRFKQNKSELGKVYGPMKAALTKPKSTKKDEDLLERKMLDDLFFA